MGEMDSEHSNNSDLEATPHLGGDNGHMIGGKDFNVENSLRKSPRLASKLPQSMHSPRQKQPGSHSKMMVPNSQSEE